MDKKILIELGLKDGAAEKEETRDENLDVALSKRALSVKDKSVEEEQFFGVKNDQILTTGKAIVISNTEKSKSEVKIVQNNQLEG